MELIDVMDNVPQKTIPVLDKGAVSLVDVMPRLVPKAKGTADFRVAEAARASFNRFEPAEKNVDLIRFLIRERHCYDRDTEVLTARGFVKWPEVTASDSLGIWDDDRHSLCYERPEYLTEDHYDGDMYSIEHTGVSLLVTPDHRMWVSVRKTTSDWKPFALIPANELGNKSMIRYTKMAPYLGQAKWNGGGMPASKDSAALLEFLGFFAGDGCASGAKSSVTFHLKKERKKVYLRSICNRMRWPIVEAPGWNGATTFRVEADGIGSLLRETGYIDKKKCIPLDVSMLGMADCESILIGLRASDGCDKRRTWTYSTNSRHLANQVQIISLHAGLVTNVVKPTGVGEIIRLNFMSQNVSPVINQDRQNTSLVPYCGMVYCAKTRTGVLVVRRNGKVVLSGNTVPSEHVKFTFHMKAPIYVTRQIDKNRTAAKSEASGRYVEFADEFHEVTADQVRRQATDNKQGSAGLLGGDAAAEFAARSRMGPMLAHEHYGTHVRDGVAKEQARTLLPMSLYTQFYWTIDLHNLLNHFLALRLDSHAQEETRQYAKAVLELIRPIVPQVVQAWEDYHPLRGGLLLSRMEVEHLRSLLAQVKAGEVAGIGKREQVEWQAKAVRLGMIGGE